MINFYKNNIKEHMEWSDKDYSIFKDRYDTSLNLFRPKEFQNKSFLYDKDYLDSCLSLFFVYSHLIEDKKAFLVSLILNGLPKDITNLEPDACQTEFLKSFFNPKDSILISLFHPTTISNIKALCEYTSTDLIYIDNLSISDRDLFDDFRLFFKALSVPLLNLTFSFNMNPRTVKYKLKDKSSYIDYNLIIETLFPIQLQIKNLNLRELFSYKVRAYIKFSQQRLDI